MISVFVMAAAGHAEPARRLNGRGDLTSEAAQRDGQGSIQPCTTSELLEAREHEHAELLTGLVEDGPPVDAVVVGDSHDPHTGVSVCFDKDSGEFDVRLRTANVAVPVIAVRGGVDLQVGQHPAGVGHQIAWLLTVAKSALAAT